MARGLFKECFLNRARDDRKSLWDFLLLPLRFAAMSDARFTQLALHLARKGYGATSPNPMVGAVLVKNGKIIGCGWHRRAGLPHAEIEALRDAEKRRKNPKGATLYVTLEPCSTHGRTPPCSEAIIAAGIKRVVVGAIDPNPRHAGNGLKILKRAGIDVVRFDTRRVNECITLNEPFNHWIVHRTPFVTVKAGMTLDGKIATASSESRWITSEQSREFAMNLRQGADAILAGVNTILADNPSLTVRTGSKTIGNIEHRTSNAEHRTRLRRIVLDSMARTPLNSKVASDEFAALTTIVVSRSAPKKRIAALAKRVRVIIAPTITRRRARSDAPYLINLRWLMKKLGAENITSLLVEGGGEVNESFLVGGFAQRVAFFYAPKVLGGRDSRKGVAGDGVRSAAEIINLRDIEWRKVGPDLFLTARVNGH
jgi:diaminohydroxyphosphoribosylaminopyrimidine deaminase/5-amino-6-(5-phosphoribosylamino)uracil reductase